MFTHPSTRPSSPSSAPSHCLLCVGGSPSVSWEVSALAGVTQLRPGPAFRLPDDPSPQQGRDTATHTSHAGVENTSQGHVSVLQDLH